MSLLMFLLLILEIGDRVIDRVRQLGRHEIRGADEMRERGFVYESIGRPSRREK